MKACFPILIVVLFFNTFCASAQSVDDMLRIAKEERSRLNALSQEYKEDVRRQWIEHMNSPWTPVEADPPLQSPMEDYPDLPMMP